MSSFKKAAQFARVEYTFYTDENKNALVPALLEIAHAISRGRRPTSCSALPGKNIQEWLKSMYYDVQEYAHDHMGEKCSYVTELEENMSYWMFCDDGNQLLDRKILEAIKICRKFVRPTAKPSDLRGDYHYQSANKVTNLKQKREWRRRKEGSCYDEHSPRSYFNTVLEHRAKIIVGAGSRSYGLNLYDLETRSIRHLR